MAEWSIAAVLKTVEVRASGGSNPSLSAENESSKKKVLDYPQLRTFFFKCYIFCFSQIHPSYGFRLKDVYANRHTATNDGKRWKKMIEIPKVLSLDMSDYKNPQLS